MMMHCLAFTLAALLATPSPAPTANPGPHVFTPAMSEAVDDVVSSEVRDGRTPGIAVGVVEDGRLVYARGFGYANVAKHLPFTASTQTYIASISGQFTAAAILLLAQDGKLNLDDPVTRYVPELTIAKDVTIAELLQQTSGLPDVTKSPNIDPDPTQGIKLSEVIAAVNQMKLVSDPGKQYQYNNFNYAIAGLIVERASGVPLSDYLQQHIFLPLVMDSTFLAGDTGISDLHAIGYTGAPERFVPARPEDPTWLYGAGDVVSNVYDLAKWDIEMPLLLREDSSREMFTPSGVLADLQYGMGWVIDERGGARFVWHNGEMAGYHTMNALLPSDHIAVIVLTNVDPTESSRTTQPEVLASRILDIVVPLPTAPLDNAVILRARDWLGRLATKRIDRVQLTPAFSNYLTDQLVANADFAQYGKVLALIPLASKSQPDGTLYEFLVHFSTGSYHFRFGIAKDGRIDALQLNP